MRKRGFLSAVAALSAFAALVSAAAPADQKIRVLLDVTYDPGDGDYALKLSPLIMEWYPKVNEELYGADHPLPFENVIVSFQPGMRYPAVTTGNVIHISAGLISGMQDDYRGMVIHELAHVVQHYTIRRDGDGWVVEGTADYIRHKYFEKDIQPTLRLNAQGQLFGYTKAEPFFFSLQEGSVDLRDKGYLKSYTVASTFLFWLEARKDPQIVHELNMALSQGQYSPDLFRQLCAQPLDDLWAAFVAESIVR